MKKSDSVNLVNPDVRLVLVRTRMRRGFAAAHCGKPLAYRNRSNEKEAAPPWIRGLASEVISKGHAYGKAKPYRHVLRQSRAESKCAKSYFQ